MTIINGQLSLQVNATLYPLEAIYSAAYLLLDKAYVILQGDPKTEIIVEIRAKGKDDLEALGNKFNDNLINYAVFKQQTEKNKEIRQTLIQRALLTNGYEEDDAIEEYLDDPEEIAVPWEEKYGEKTTE